MASAWGDAAFLGISNMTELSPPLLGQTAGQIRLITACHDWGELA
jgi:hypothetical protein